MKSNTVWFALILLICSICACNRKVVHPSGMSKLPENVCRMPSTLSVTDGTVSYKSSSRNLSAKLQLYLNKNNSCSFQASILFVEVARGLVTNDSVFVLNRLDRTCMTASLRDVEKAYGIRITPEFISMLLSGTLCTDLLGETGIEWTMQATDRLAGVTRDGQSVMVEGNLQEAQLYGIAVSDKKGVLVEAELKNFHTVGSYNLPSEIEVSMPQKNRRVVLKCTDTHPDVNKTVNFSIPSGYSRITFRFE